MLTKTVKVLEPNGLHLRLAASIVKRSKDFKSNIVVCRDCKYADACSIWQLLLLQAKNGSELRITATGEDEEKAVQELSFLFTDGAGI